ncbi:MAG: hypothetical protein QW128_00695 [Thermoprotei archaeon]
MGRGVGGIVAAMFFIAVALLMFIGLELIMIYSNNIQSAILSREASESEKLNERLFIQTVMLGPGNRLNATVINTGSVVVNIVRIWLINVTNNYYYNFDINPFIILNPGESVSNIGSNIIIQRGNIYVLKLVTSRGNIFSARFAPSKQARLQIQLYASPPLIASGQRASLLLIIRNNDTRFDAVYDLTPVLNISGNASYSIVASNAPTIPWLGFGDVAVFKWDVLISGAPSSVVIFNASYSDAPKGFYDIAVVKVTYRPLPSIPRFVYIVAYPKNGTVIQTKYKEGVIQLVVNATNLVEQTLNFNITVLGYTLSSDTKIGAFPQKPKGNAVNITQEVSLSAGQTKSLLFNFTYYVPKDGEINNYFVFVVSVDTTKTGLPIISNTETKIVDVIITK